MIIRYLSRVTTRFRVRSCNVGSSHLTVAEQSPLSEQTSPGPRGPDILFVTSGVLLSSNTSTRKRIDPAVLADAIKKRDDKIAKRRAQWRKAGKRKRAKKRQALALATGRPRTVLEHLSSGEFPEARPIEAMARLGLTNNEIADVLGVNKNTFVRWTRISPLLKAALQRGRTVADTHVAESLFMQAVGYSIPEEKIFYDSKRGKVVKTNTEHYYPPNVVASIFWLKNRYADFWRDRKVDEQGPAGLTNVQQVKFVLVQSPGGQSAKDREKIIDADYKIIAPIGTKSKSVSEES